MAGVHSATSSISGSVLGKREVGMASESDKEEVKPKRRRVAPTLVTNPVSPEILDDEKSRN
jgi:hypothetical protein